MSTPFFELDHSNLNYLIRFAVDWNQEQGHSHTSHTFRSHTVEWYIPRRVTCKTSKGGRSFNGRYATILHITIGYRGNSVASNGNHFSFHFSTKSFMSFQITESEFGERGAGKFREQRSTRRCYMYKNQSRSECMAANDIGKIAGGVYIAFKIIRLQRRHLYEDIENNWFPNRSKIRFK